MESVRLAVRSTGPVKIGFSAEEERCVSRLYEVIFLISPYPLPLYVSAKKVGDLRVVFYTDAPVVITEKGRVFYGGRRVIPYANLVCTDGSIVTKRFSYIPIKNGLLCVIKRKGECWLCQQKGTSLGLYKIDIPEGK